MLEFGEGNKEAMQQEYQKGLDFFGSGQFEAAAAKFQEILKNDPGFFDAYEALSRTYYRMDRLDDAIQWMEKLAALRPDYAMAHTNLSVYYMRKGLKERAEEEKAKATVLNFGQGPSRNLAGGN